MTWAEIARVARENCKWKVEAGLSTKDLRGCVEAYRPLTTLEAAIWLPSITNGQRCWSLHILRQHSSASSKHLSQHNISCRHSQSHIKEVISWIGPSSKPPTDPSLEPATIICTPTPREVKTNQLPNQPPTTKSAYFISEGELSNPPAIL